MKFEELDDKDIKLIKDAMIQNSVTLIAECQECKKVMSKESYERDIQNGRRLVHLINVLNNKEEYKRIDDKYINVEVEITKVNNEKVSLIEEFPTHYTDGNISEILWDRYTDKYGELKKIDWKEL
ncbi:MAG: hypothetical protein AB2417_02700 [Clostridiaceae bacterium]